MVQRFTHCLNNLTGRFGEAYLTFLFLATVVFSVQVEVVSAGPRSAFTAYVPACTAPAWNSATAYLKGSRVSFDNKIYEARWWTQNESPALRSGEWDVWKYLGACDSGNSNPIAVITSPAENAFFNAPATIVINVTASDADGTITKVEFFNGQEKLGEDTSQPYSFSWQNVNAGSYALTAKATDNANGTSTSVVVNVSVVEAGNIKPNAVITAPTTNTAYTAPAIILISAMATDADGTVTKVEFFNGTNWLGEDTSAPYAYTWSNVVAGTYTVTAKATDNTGATGLSAAVTLEVTEGSGGTCNVPAYTGGAVYHTGDLVKHNNKKYACEVGGWCSLGGAYEPGVGWAWDNAWEYNGECGVTNAPTVSITSPANNTIVETGQTIGITASAGDSDGTVTMVEFFVDGTSVGTDASSPYSISWEVSAGYHTLTVKASDNSGNSTISSAVTIQTSDAEHGDLPARILSGYWHAWNGGVPFIKLRDVSPKWDVINVSFAEPVSAGSTDGQMKFVLYGATADYTVDNFKADVKLLQSRGKKVIISIGGYEGYFSLTTPAARDNFINGMKSIIDEYGFDGIDIDLEQSSLELSAGDADFRNPTSPKVVHMISAIRALCDYYGNDFLLTFAPEAFYLQLGYQWYAGIHAGVDRRAGVYIPVIHALRDKITYVQAQLYNQPSIMALDGRLYTSGTADYLVAMSDMLLKGFNVGGNAGYFFPPLRPDQVLFGVPASAGAAGSGQVTPQQLHHAFDYMVKGTAYGGQYQLSKTYPALRGIMTWSINWDAYQNTNAFVNTHRAYLDGLGAVTLNFETVNVESLVGRGPVLAPNRNGTAAVIYPNPSQRGETASIRWTFDKNPNIVKVQIKDTNGVDRFTISYPVNDEIFLMELPSLPPGLYYIRFTVDDKTEVSRYLVK